MGTRIIRNDYLFTYIGTSMLTAPIYMSMTYMIIYFNRNPDAQGRVDQCPENNK